MEKNSGAFLNWHLSFLYQLALGRTPALRQLISVQTQSIQTVRNI